MSSIFDLGQLPAALAEEDRFAIAGLRVEIEKRSEKSWILYRDEPGDFALSFLALLYAGKDIHLSGVAPSKNHSDSPALFCDDKEISDFSYDLVAMRSSGRESFEESSLVCRDNRIVFHTSGSTGQPKDVSKELFQLENEVQQLKSLWGGVIKDSTVYTTVSHQHIYGILFSILLPLSADGIISPKRLHYPESLYSLPEGKSNLISSPAFLKRIASLERSLSDRKEKIIPFSSGGFLPPGTASHSLEFFGNPIKEIYGSTETGGIAWKESPLESFWKPFEVVSLIRSQEGTLAIQSPYLPGDGKYVLEDRIEIQRDGSFHLCGRSDSVVKVEDKRIALNDLENRILETGYVSNVLVFSLEGKREFIAAAIELNDKGHEKFAQKDRQKINSFFRKSLAAYFHPTVLPKKWRYPEKMPVNAQGKIMRSEVKTLFEKNLVDDPLIIKQETIENGWELLISFPPEYRYFDGHFPEMKILPAVVQIHWVMSIFKDKTGLSPAIEHMPKIKFQNPIFPNMKVRVRITWNQEKNKIRFDYSSDDESRKFSGGNIYVRF